MTTPDERLARLEAHLSGLRDSVGELRDETMRTRSRLHDLEGIASMLVDQEKYRREATANRQKRMERRISILAVAVSFAAVVEPFLYHAAGGG